MKIKKKAERKEREDARKKISKVEEVLINRKIEDSFDYKKSSFLLFLRQVLEHVEYLYCSDFLVINSLLHSLQFLRILALFLCRVAKHILLHVACLRTLN